jgi:hypothetical protein
VILFLDAEIATPTKLLVWSSKRLTATPSPLMTIKWVAFVGCFIKKQTEKFHLFFERHELSGKWKCKITHKLFAELPMPVRGGILADDMGLGKTVQMTALILANPPAGQKGYPYLQSRNKTDAFRCTIIVCPVSVISNWSLQLSKYVSKEARLKVEIYHGPGRHDMLEKICDNKIDVLLTSFDTLASDYKKLELSMESEEKEAEEPNREETEIPTAKPVSR